MFFYFICIFILVYCIFNCKSFFNFFNFLFFCLLYITILNMSFLYNLKPVFLNSTPLFWNILNLLNDPHWSFIALCSIYMFIFRSTSLLIFVYILSVILFNISTTTNSIYNVYLLNSFLNTTLFNGLLLIHPIYLYASYSFLFFLFLKVTSLFNTYINNRYLFFLSKFLFLIKINFIYSSTALVLGSFWAQQELNWGGWWNWDSIELIAFCVSIVTCIFLHINYIYLYKYLLIYKLFLIPLLIFFYFLSRLDVLSSIHSFVIFSSSLDWYEIKLYIIYILYIFILSFYKLFFNTSLKENSNKIFFIKKFFILIYFYIIIILLLFALKNILVGSVYLTESKSIKYILYLLFVIVIYYNNVLFNNKSFIINIVLILFLFTIGFSIIDIIFLTFILILFFSYFTKKSLKFTHVIFILIIIYILLFSTIEVFCFFKYNKYRYGQQASYIFSNNQYNSYYTTILSQSDFFFLKNFNYQYKNINFINIFSFCKNTMSQYILSNNYFNINLIPFKKLFLFGQFYIVCILYLYIISFFLIYFFSKPLLYKVV